MRTTLLILGVSIAIATQIGMNERTNDTFVKPFQATPQIAPSVPNIFYASPSELKETQAQLLDSRKGEIERKLNLYNYDVSSKAWIVKELQAGILRKHAIFYVVILGLPEGTSRFVLVVPFGQEEVRIIPLYYQGLGFGRKPEGDPHNIAIFNELISSEHPVPDTDLARLGLAVLYLHLFLETPEILTESDFKTLTGVNFKRTERQLLPRISPEPDGAFDIEIVCKSGDESFTEYAFKFDKQGLLRSVVVSVETKKDLLEP